MKWALAAVGGVGRRSGLVVKGATGGAGLCRLRARSLGHRARPNRGAQFGSSAWVVWLLRVGSSLRTLNLAPLDRSKDRMQSWTRRLALSISSTEHTQANTGGTRRKEAEGRGRVIANKNRKDTRRRGEIRPCGIRAPRGRSTGGERRVSERVESSRATRHARREGVGYRPGNGDRCRGGICRLGGEEALR